MATVTELSTWAYDNCVFEANFFSPYLVLLRYAPRVINLASYIVSLYYRELFIGLVGVLLTLSDILNVYVLKPLIRQPVPQPQCGSSTFYCLPPNATECGHDSPIDCVPCGMPSYGAQQIAAFVTAILVYSLQYPALKLKWSHYALLIALEALAMYSYVHFHFNTLEQVVVGAMVGSLYMALGVSALYGLLSRYYDALLYHWSARKLGYVDSLTRYHAPVPGDPDTTDETTLE